MEVSPQMVAEAIASKILASPELRAEYLAKVGGGAYLTQDQVAKKLKIGKGRIPHLPIEAHQLPGERGKRWFEPEIDRYMHEERKIGNN